jgi:hypothetical protein
MMQEKLNSLRAKPAFQMNVLQKMGLIIISAAGLCFEINLTRLYSVSHFYHFAFMVVSIALLGFGASGTFLAVFRIRNDKPFGRRLAWMAIGAGLSMLGSYLLINLMLFDSFSMAVDRKQILILMLHYVALASPFFFVGTIISLLLSKHAQSGGRVYALNLLGSALGCLAAVLAPTFIGGEGTVVLSIMLAGLAALTFLLGSQSGPKRKNIQDVVGTAAIFSLLVFSMMDIGLRMGANGGFKIMELNLSPYKGISYAMQNPEAEIIYSKWNAISRVDVVHSPSLHSVPGLSYRYLEPLPPIRGLYINGDNLSTLLPAESDIDFAGYLPAAIAFYLRPKARVLIMESRGGMDVLAALALDAQQVTAVEENMLLIEAAVDIYNLPDVEIAITSGRSYLRSTNKRFDVIQLSLINSYHPVSSGAYSLGEDYRYTLESFSDMLDCLERNGLLVVTRWLQEQPSEWLRTFTLAVSTLEARGADPQKQIVALRGYNTGTLLVKNGFFTSKELALIRTFVDEKAFDLVFAPDIQLEEINRNNILPEEVYFQTFADVLKNKQRGVFYKQYMYDVRPPVDDHPFFGHYFKWSQIGGIWRSLGTTWQPFGGAGFLVILAIFGLAVILAGVLIILPAIVKKETKNMPVKGNIRIFVYFGMIGLAFLLVEMPMIQQFILYLDHPTYAMAVVLFSLLLFSGFGSRWGIKIMSVSAALLILLVFLTGWLFLLPALLYATLGFPLTVRISVSIISVAPIGFLMGIPFPAGLEWMWKSALFDEKNFAEEMVAWLWAVNGSTSVIASILSSLLSLSFGFNRTFAVGMICYLVAWIMVSDFGCRSELPHQ